MPKKIIYADDVIDAFRNHVRGGHIILPYEYIKDIVLSLPSAQPQRIKGRWVGTDYDGFADGNPVYDEWKCSICGCVVEDEEPTWNFCPNCGAWMLEEPYKEGQE